MITYRPIACYNTAEDILNLFPFDERNALTAEYIIQRFNEGFGDPHKYDETDPESYWTEAEVKEDENFFIVSDGKYGVRYTKGAIASGIPFGFYIDIYEAVSENDKSDGFDTHSNLATEIMHLIHRAMLSKHNPSPFDGEQTRIVIEHPGGSYEPVTFAWYDKENNIIRLCYDKGKADDGFDVEDFVARYVPILGFGLHEYELEKPVPLSDNRIATKFWADDGNDDIRVEIWQTYPNQAWRENAFLSSMDECDAVKVANAIIDRVIN